MNTRKTQKDSLFTPTRASRAKSADRLEKNNITVSDLVDDILTNNDQSDTPKSNPNSPLTMGLMMELLKKLETNINARIDSKIDEVKMEVSSVKNHLANFDIKFEEVEQRITTNEDLIESVGTKLNDAQQRISSVEDQVHDLNALKTDFHAFRADWDQALTELELESCRARKNNIIFQGIPGGDKDPKKAMQTFMTLCRYKLEMSEEWLSKVDINECYRFPPKGGDGSWPLFLSLAKSRHREDLYRAAPKLKDSGIQMRNDLAPCLQRKRKLLIEDSITLRNATNNCDTRLRDSAFKVWMIFKRPNGKEWETWKGKL